jgi:hypothetical protein
VGQIKKLQQNRNGNLKHSSEASALCTISI